LKHKSETPATLKTQRRRWPQPTWWGTPVANKLVLEGRREQWSSVHSRHSVQASPSCRWARWMGAQAQASHASPSAMGEVDGGKVRARGAARDVVGCGGGEEGRREARRSARGHGALAFFLRNCGAEYRSG
jgi:hypothetical protein